ncbi:MAG: hypothetical protein HOV81_37895 [Kofleriaceae bacterium]|nr:hypothetical protein [Kofleriaceae bacterium]
MVTDDSLHGRAVLTNDGVRVGELEHLLIEPGRLQVAGVQVRVPKDVADQLGIPHGLLRGTSVEVPIEQVRSIGDAVLLSVDQDALRRTKSSPTEPSTPGV